jgi:hypothetical protein
LVLQEITKMKLSQAYTCLSSGPNHLIWILVIHISDLWTYTKTAHRFAARCGRSWKNKMHNIWCGKGNWVPSSRTGEDTRGQCPCYANMVNSKKGRLLLHTFDVQESARRFDEIRTCMRPLLFQVLLFMKNTKCNIIEHAIKKLDKRNNITYEFKCSWLSLARFV